VPGMDDRGATTAQVAASRSTLEQFRWLVLGVRDYAIFLLDRTGHVSTWNSGAEAIKGYTAEEIVGQHFSRFYTDEDRAIGHPAAELEIAARVGRHEEEGWRVRKDGTHFWANVVLNAVRDDQGELLGFAKVTRDLTERRASDDALRAANQRLARTNRELDRFAAVAAHDLQEPLRTVAGFAEILAERHVDGLDERGRAFLGHISAGVDRMQRLVDDLLGYAKAAEAVPAARSIGLEAATTTVLAELSATIGARDAELVVELAPGVAVRAHARDVEAALRNLISNAVKFADRKRPVVIVRATTVEHDVRVEVVDNGIGIDPEDRPRLFRPFQRLQSAAEYPGSGLGLAIAQRVVERNGGAIGVDSVVGRGSCFWFQLPAG
jgi:PAS domain S-box-containing protein